MSRSVFSALLVGIFAVSSSAADRGQLDFSPSLFTVMAAINAVGYDTELDSPNNDPLRRQIRQALETAHPPVLADLKKFFVEHHQKDATAELGQYVSFALCVGDPPDFKFRYRDVELPPDVRQIQTFLPLLIRFYKEANIADLWNRSQAAFERALTQYHAPVSRAILEANSYLRNATSGFLGRNFQIYLDLLGAPNQVQTRSYANDYFVVVTPSADPRVMDIRHAYLHYLLDPLATKYGEDIMKRESLIDYAAGAPALADSYKSDFLLLTTESLIKAVEARLPGTTEPVDEALREGYILTPFFAEQLTAFEKQPQDMRLFFPEMIKRLDVVREDQRLSKVQFAERAPVRIARMVETQPRAEPDPAQKAIDAADKLYSAKDYEHAKQAYLRVLERTTDKSIHARAYYGLARIAVLENDAETGQRLFQKVLDTGADSWVTAWTQVYLGRLADVAGNRDDATKHYQSALAVDGASQGARHAAQQGLQQSFKKP